MWWCVNVGQSSLQAARLHVLHKNTTNNITVLQNFFIFPTAFPNLMFCGLPYYYEQHCLSFPKKSRYIYRSHKHGGAWFLKKQCFLLFFSSQFSWGDELILLFRIDIQYHTYLQFIHWYIYYLGSLLYHTHYYTIIIISYIHTRNHMLIWIKK